MSTPVKNDSITATSSTSSSTPSQPPMQNNSPYPMQPIPQPPSSQQQQQQHLQQPIPPIPVQIMPQPVQPQQQQQQQQQQQVPPQYTGNYYQQRPAPGYFTPSSSLDFIKLEHNVGIVFCFNQLKDLHYNINNMLLVIQHIYLFHNHHNVHYCNNK